MSSANPFLDPAIVSGLYDSGDRLTRRTSALHRAKVAGSYVPDVIAGLAVTCSPSGCPTVLDLGCGRGSTTVALAGQLPKAEIIALDLSPALLAIARERTAEHGKRVRFLQADFHALPVKTAGSDLVVTAFCLYHSPQPTAVIYEITRCLSANGHAILVAKSTDSYRELDELISDCGLDPMVPTRPSLYQTANSENLADLTASSLNVIEVIHETHHFRFADFDHLADYLTTTPKYALHTNPHTLASQLRSRTPEVPVTATSTVTYVVAQKEGTP